MHQILKQNRTALASIALREAGTQTGANNLSFHKFKVPRDEIRLRPLPCSIPPARCAAPYHRGYELLSFGAIPFIDLLLFCGFQNENSVHWNAAVAARRSGRKDHAISGRKSKKWHQSQSAEHSVGTTGERGEGRGGGDLVKNNDSVQAGRGELHIVHGVRLMSPRHPSYICGTDHATSLPIRLIAAMRKASSPRLHFAILHRPN